MKKKHSLTSSKDFDFILNKGEKVRTKYLFISYINSEDFKIGISIPKKLGNAVFRNKNKRRIKNLLNEVDIYNKKIHIVLIVKKDFTTLKYLEMKKSLNIAFSKIKNNNVIKEKEK